MVAYIIVYVDNRGVTSNDVQKRRVTIGRRRESGVDDVDGGMLERSRIIAGITALVTIVCSRTSNISS